MKNRRHHRKFPQFVVNSKFTLPADKPDIDFLLRITATATIEKTIVTAKKIDFCGHIDIFTEYVASVPDGTQPVTFICFKLPFNGIFAHRHARAGMDVRLKSALNIQDVSLTNPRNAAILLSLKVFYPKFVYAGKPLLPHACKPFSINFFDTNQQTICIPQNRTFQSTLHPDFIQSSPIAETSVTQNT